VTRPRGAALRALALALLVTAYGPAFAVASTLCDERTAVRRPFFGDTQVHTAFSFDAWGQGTMAGP